LHRSDGWDWLNKNKFPKFGEVFRGQHSKKEQVMPNGTVKWFNNAKGFGFILPDGGGEDLFAHYSSIAMDGYKTLKAGQMVTFEMVQGQKGMHATQIKVLLADRSNPSAPQAAQQYPDSIKIAEYASEDA
jgi:cold shock protein